MSGRGRSVLVTGGAGLIGSHLVDRLLQMGCRVTILDSLESYTHPGGVAPSWLPGEAKMVHGGLLDRDALLDALQGVDRVYHQAAFTGFDSDSTAYLKANAAGTARLFDVIAEHRMPVRKIVVASSLSVYGEGAYGCETHGRQYPDMRAMQRLRRGAWDPACAECGAPLMWKPTPENAPTAPFTPYAVSKHAGEMLALSLGKRFEIPTVALRYAVTYGPRQSTTNAYSTVITTFASLLRNGCPPVLYEDGTQCRDWTYVDDIVSANLHVMQDPRADFRSFNVGTGEAFSVRRVAELLAKKLGRSIEPLCRGEYRPGDIRNSVLDVARLKSLGWRPEVSLPEGLDRFLAWFETLDEVEERYTALEGRLREAGELRAGSAGAG